MTPLPTTGMWVSDEDTNPSEAGTKSGRAKANVPLELLDPFPRHALALAEDIGKKVAERRAALASLPPPPTTPTPPPERPNGVAAWALKFAPTDDLSLAAERRRLGWGPPGTDASANSANSAPNSPSDGAADLLDGRVDLRSSFPNVYCVDAARTEFRDDAVSIDVQNSRIAVITPPIHMTT